MLRTVRKISPMRRDTYIHCLFDSIYLGWKTVQEFGKLINNFCCDVEFLLNEFRNTLRTHWIMLPVGKKSHECERTQKYRYPFGLEANPCYRYITTWSCNHHSRFPQNMSPWLDTDHNWFHITKGGFYRLARIDLKSRVVRHGVS